MPLHYLMNRAKKHGMVTIPEIGKKYFKCTEAEILEYAKSNKNNSKTGPYALLPDYYRNIDSDVLSIPTLEE